MHEAIRTKTITVEVQENGIIRNDKGRIIARLVEDIDFDSEHIVVAKQEWEPYGLFIARGCCLALNMVVRYAGVVVGTVDTIHDDGHIWMSVDGRLGACSDMTKLEVLK